MSNAICTGLMSSGKSFSLAKRFTLNPFGTVICVIASSGSRYGLSPSLFGPTVGTGGRLASEHWQVAAARQRPDAVLAVLGLHVALRHLRLHDVRVGELRSADAGFVADLRAAAVDVVGVDGAIAVVPFEVLLHHGRPQLLDIDARRGRRAEECLHDHRRERLVARFGEMNAIHREGFLLLGRRGEKLLRGREEIDERNVIRLRHLCHGGSVLLQIAVVRRRGEVRVLMLLRRDRREEDDARRALPAEVLGLRLLEKAVQILAELLQPALAGKGFIPAEEGEHHIRLHPREPLVRGVNAL